jgi:hypothetical protein
VTVTTDGAGAAGEETGATGTTAEEEATTTGAAGEVGFGAGAV